jgi:diguanylate cyclase (GGDEF)-like protein
VVGAIWLLGLTALAAVLVLQGRLDQRRQAQLAIASLRVQVSTLPKTALGLNGSLNREQVQAQLDVAEGQFLETAATLDRLGGNHTDSRLISKQARALFPLLAEANKVSSSGHLRAATVALGLALLPGQPAFALNQTFDTIGARYGDEAASARQLADLGSAAAILLLLVAFSIALWRAARLARENHVLLEQSRQDALTDELTGLWNRRKLFGDLDHLLAHPDGEPTAIGVLDLDGFKAYNDRFGHPAGDALLARMGGALRSAVDGEGAAYRLGGDEFCVIASGHDAGEVLERARITLAERAGGLHISCSLGSAWIAADGATGDELIRTADERLYENKRSARAAHRIVAV